MSSLIDYAWNPYYSTRNPPQIAGMPASRLGASAVEVGVNQNLAAQYAKRTKAEKYGIYLMYNLRKRFICVYLGGDTRTLWSKNELFTNCSNTLIIISCLQAPTCKELKASLLQAGFLVS